MRKTLTETEGNFFNLIKGIYEKNRYVMLSTANIKLTGKAWMLSLKIRYKIGYLHFPLLFNPVLEIPASAADSNT